jgi:hypothetical protein
MLAKCFLLITETSGHEIEEAIHPQVEIHQQTMYAY